MRDSELILQICRAYPQAANNDDVLTVKVWAAQHQLPCSESQLYDLLAHVTDQGTIKRRRRQLHQEGRVNYSPQTETRRFKQFQENRFEYVPQRMF